MAQYLGSSDDLISVFSHQGMIGGDIGFTLCTVQNQGVYGVLGVTLQFDTGGKARAA